MSLPEREVTKPRVFLVEISLEESDKVEDFFDIFCIVWIETFFWLWYHAKILVEKKLIVFLSEEDTYFYCYNGCITFQ